LLPHDIKIKYNLGTALVMLHQYAAARVLYKEILAVHPEEDSTLNNLFFIETALAKAAHTPPDPLLEQQRSSLDIAFILSKPPMVLTKPQPRKLETARKSEPL
jgi:hypothetical protein